MQGEQSSPRIRTRAAAALLCVAVLGLLTICLQDDTGLESAEAIRAEVKTKNAANDAFQGMDAIDMELYDQRTQVEHDSLEPGDQPVMEYEDKNDYEDMRRRIEEKGESAAEVLGNIMHQYRDQARGVDERQQAMAAEAQRHNVKQAQDLRKAAVLDRESKSKEHALVQVAAAAAGRPCPCAANCKCSSTSCCHKAHVRLELKAKRIAREKAAMEKAEKLRAAKAPNVPKPAPKPNGVWVWKPNAKKKPAPKAKKMAPRKKTPPAMPSVPHLTKVVHNIVRMNPEATRHAYQQLMKAKATKSKLAKARARALKAAIRGQRQARREAKRQLRGIKRNLRKKIRSPKSAAAHGKLKGAAVKGKPAAVKAKPAATKAKPAPVKVKPAAKAKPAAVKAKPAAAKAKPAAKTAKTANKKAKNTVKNKANGATKKAAVEESLLQVGFSGMSGINLAPLICKMRVALNMAKAKFPNQIHKLESTPVYLKYKTPLDKLRSCLESTQTDVQCEALLKPLMAHMMDLITQLFPAIKKMEKEMGPALTQAEAKKCTAANTTKMAKKRTKKKAEKKATKPSARRK
jgi:hypothetical protein